MHSPLCDIPVHVEPHLVIVAMVFAVIFATTTCGLAICSYIHIFGGLGRPAAISLAVLLAWYTLDTAYWITPLANGIRVYLRALVVGGRASFNSSLDGDIDVSTVSPAPVLMCATPGFLAISILVGEIILWWRVCVVWAGNRAVKCICIVSLFVTVVFVGVTTGRLEIMKAPPTRLAVMFFVEADGIGTSFSVFVSSVVVGVLLNMKRRTKSFHRHASPQLLMHMPWVLRTRTRGPARKTGRTRECKGTTRRLADLALWSAVAGTFLGASWVMAAASRRQIWTTLRDDAPTWSFWNFALFVTTASCMRVPALVWLLPRSFAFAPSDDVGAPSGDPERTLDRIAMHEHPCQCHIELHEREGGASYAEQLGHQKWTVL